MVIGIAVTAIVLLLLHLLLLLVGSLKKDSNIRNYIVMQGGRSVGNDIVSHSILYQAEDETETMLAARYVPQSSVTSTFMMLYIQLVDIENAVIYDGFLDKQVEIGRTGGPANIQINDRAVSNKHCCISRRGGQLLIQDLGSTNHTRVNNCLLEAPMPLAFGDLVTIGNHTYKFQFFDAQGRM